MCTEKLAAALERHHRCLQAFTLLFSSFFLPSFLAAEGKDKTETREFNLRSVPEVPGLVAGIEKRQINKKASSSYLMRYRGLEDRLDPGEAPDFHLKRCVAGEKANEFSSSPMPPDQRRLLCVEGLVLWGYILLSNSIGTHLEDESLERELGQRFMARGFELLLADLKEGGDDRLLGERLNADRDFAFSLSWRSAENFSKDDWSAALQYYSYVWNALSDAPVRERAFRQKILAGEQLKALYLKIADNKAPIDRSLAESGIAFFDQAARFHQLAVPNSGKRMPSGIIYALLIQTMRAVGTGYAVFPWDPTAFRPTAALAITDFVGSQMLLHRMSEAQLISESEFSSRSMALRKEETVISIAEIERWLEEAKKQHDTGQMIELESDVFQFYGGIGDLAAAEQKLKAACQQLHDLGDLRTWAESKLNLSAVQIMEEHWQDALESIEQAKPGLADGFLIKELSTAVEKEQSVRQKLGLPAVDSALVDTVVAKAKGFPNLEEPDRTKRIQNLRSYLALPNAPPYLRLIAEIALLKALREVREFEEAERLAIQLRPEIKRWRGIPGEEDILESLLELESSRGNFGAFYGTFAEYEAIARQWRGNNWTALFGRNLAQIFLQLQEYHRAEDLLQGFVAQERLESLRSATGEFMNSYVAGTKGDVVVFEEDQLLEARIQMALGKKDSATETIGELEASLKTSNRAAEVVDDIWLQLAEFRGALGENKEALASVNGLLSRNIRLDNADVWAKALILQARLGLNLGQPVADKVATLEELVPNLTQFPELNAVNAVDMDIFLADYYLAQKSPEQALANLKSGLELAKTLGALDQEIIIHRKLGELAARRDDLTAAVDEYRQSIGLLAQVSGSIPSDLGKVGYRAERNKAVPFLVLTLYELYLRTQQQSYLEDMFEVIEEGKSRALAEMVSASRGTLAEFHLSTVRGNFPADAVLFEYYLPEGAERVFRLQLSRDSISVDVLSLKPDELTARVQGLLDQVLSEPFNEKAFRDESATLGKILLPAKWSPLKPRHLFIVPTGALYLLPFSLLVDEQGHYLDENQDIDIAYLPSASLLERQVPHFSDASRSAGFVNPARELQHHEELSQIGDLQGRLQQAFGKWGGGRIAWEQPLTRFEFLREAGNLDNLFVYTHARFVPEDPMGSYILLSGNSSAGSRLSAADLVATTKVGGGLWVLAACSTGQGKVQSGDEVLGLPRALMEAGANMVVISLWDVGAHSSLELMTRFYQNLAGGMSVSGALHHASTALRQAGNPPYDWAPFILIGHHGFAD